MKPILKKIWVVYLFLIFATLFWSSNVVFGRAVYQIISPLTLSFWRWAIASLLLLPIALPYLRQDSTLIIKHWRILLLLSFLGVSLFNSILYYSTHTTGATNLAVIQTSLPIFIVILSFFLLAKKISKGMLIGIILGIGGAVIVIAKGDLANLKQFQFAKGDIYMLFAVFSYALYSVLLAKLPAIKPISLLMVIFSMGSVLLLPFYLVEYFMLSPAPLTSEMVLPIIYVAIFPSILAYGFWNHGVTVIGAGTTGLFICFIPIFTPVLAAFFLNEQLQYYHLVGMVLIITSVIVVHRFNLSNAQSKKQSVDG